MTNINVTIADTIVRTLIRENDINIGNKRASTEVVSFGHICPKTSVKAHMLWKDSTYTIGRI